MAEPREQLAEALTSFLTPEQVRKLVDEVLSIQKRSQCEFNCKKCGARQIQFGTVSDAKAVALALPDLLNQAYGRPGEEANQGEPVLFLRVSSIEEAEEKVEELRPSKAKPRTRKKAA